MDKEEFTIRVTRKGELILDLRGLPPRRVKELVAYFEETLGPTRQLAADSGGSASGGEELVEEEDIRAAAEVDEDQDEERPRLRILRD